MIQKLQYFSQSKIAKAFLLIVALSFAIFFGGGQWFSTHDSHNVVAEVGDTRVTRNDFIGAYKQELQHISKMIKGLDTPEAQLQAGVPRYVLEQMIHQILLDQEARNLGLTISDDEIKNQIQQMKEFKDAKGQFDKQRFIQMLHANGFFEDAFINMMRKDLIRLQLVEAIQTGASLPPIAEEKLFNAQYETRKASMMLITPESMPRPSSPTDATLRSYYDKNHARFALPELRSFKAIVLSPDSISKTITITDEEISAEYQAQHEKYGKKKLENVRSEIEKDIKKQKANEQMFTLAQSLEDELAGGMTFEELAKKHNLELLSFNELSKEGFNLNGEIPARLAKDSDLKDSMLTTVFETEEKADSPFTHTANGTYYSIKVEKVDPSHTPSYEESKNRVLSTWQRHEQAKAAKEKAVALVKDINNSKKKSASFKPLPELSLRNPSNDIDESVKKLIFSLKKGQAGYTITNKGFAVVFLDQVTPPSPKTKNDHFAKFQRELKKQYSQNVLNSYVQALKIHYPIKINGAALQAIFASSPRE